MSSEQPSHYEIRFARRVERQLKQAFRGRPARVREEFLETLDILRENPFPIQGNARIRHLGGNRFRARVADNYRLVYAVEEGAVIVQAFGHRRDVYDGLS